MQYEAVLADLQARPKRWLVTGAAGFIGSNILETLLRAGQQVTGLDNFSNGSPANLQDVRQRVGDEAWANHDFLEGDIRDLGTCHRVCAGVDIILHQAALGSVPRSICDPLTSHAVNVDGFLNMLVAARDAGVARMVFASSSSVYGDDPHLPKIEQRTGRPLSPYALTKVINERYAEVFGLTYGLKPIGLRYFNVFGPRQKPDGPYAAVIPRWIRSLVNGERCQINGDGGNSRDFCYVANAVQANILAAMADDAVMGHIFNVSIGGSTSLNELYRMIQTHLGQRYPDIAQRQPIYAPFRDGDIAHSQADITQARSLLGYEPTHTVAQGLAEMLPDFAEKLVGTLP